METTKNKIQKITPFLWFNREAEEAANFYTSLFGNSGIVSLNRYGEGAPLPAGTVMTVSFRLEGQDFTALNGGPVFSFSPSISFVVNCESQQEVDHYWDNLSEGGEQEQCGWLKDKYGVSWQIVPLALFTYLGDGDPERSQRVMNAMLQMKKIEIDGLKKAFEGR
jgi:predicted 3-demethylubiquinone-9 3-methyltransferase (glyoxalase superfamily)